MIQYIFDRRPSTQHVQSCETPHLRVEGVQPGNNKHELPTLQRTWQRTRQRRHQRDLSGDATTTRLDQSTSTDRSIDSSLGHKIQSQQNAATRHTMYVVLPGFSTNNQDYTFTEHIAPLHKEVWTELAQTSGFSDECLRPSVYFDWKRGFSP